MTLSVPRGRACRRCAGRAKLTGPLALPVARATLRPVDPSDEVDPAALQDAIRHLHGVESRFVERVEVREVFEGKVVWEGEVSVFDLVGHPSPRAYAWSYSTTGAKRRFVAVLHEGPIDSPINAVRAAVVAEGKARQN
jgi:hypothetical protein